MVLPMERTTWAGAGVEGLLDRALRLLDRPGRAVLGIAGAPASGKSTLAALLLAELERQRPGEAVGVGMDAFHLGHRVLVRRGQTEIKGAPETFDAVGYLHLLQRIRTETGTVYAPEFDRDIEDSLAHVVEIGPEVGLVVTEGNYLLLDDTALGRRTRAARRGVVRAPGRRGAAAADGRPAPAARPRPGRRRGPDLRQRRAQRPAGQRRTEPPRPVDRAAASDAG